jgi:hypothetical protein
MNSFLKFKKYGIELFAWTYCLMIFTAFSCRSQSVDELMAEMLKKNEIGKVFSFDYSRENEFNQLYFRYLGNIKASLGEEYKILNFSRVWGPNKHSTGIIYIFNKENEGVGRYVLGDARDLPEKIEFNLLIFEIKREGCDSGNVTKLDFSNGLKKEIFIKCKGKFGDVYSLSQFKL